MSLQGASELRSRLKAIRLVFKPVGRSWADETVRRARSMVPVRTSRLRGSIRVRNASQRKATVAAHFTAFFVSSGTREHVIKPRNRHVLKFQTQRNTVFAPKARHPRTSGNSFRSRAARGALEATPMAQVLINLWNRAA